MAPVTPQDPSSAPSGQGDPGSPAEPQPKSVLDYVSEIRQSLVSEETGGRSSRRSTGGLIHRITGSLRHVTGSLRAQTGALPPLKDEKPEPAAEEEPASAEPPAAQPTAEAFEELTGTAPETPAPEAEIGDDFLAGRLGGTGMNGPETWPGTQSEEPERPASPHSGEDSFAEETMPGWIGPSAPRFDSEDDFGIEGSAQEADREAGDSPSSMFATLGVTGEDEKQGQEPDWMSAIREEAAQEEAAHEKKGSKRKPTQPDEDKSASRGMTGPVRTFITTVLRRTEEKQKPPAENEIPEDMLTGRLERNLGPDFMVNVPEEEAAGQEPEAPELSGDRPAAQEPGTGEAIDGFDFDKHFATLFGEEETSAQAETGEDNSLLEGLEARFGQVEGTAEDFSGRDYQINNLLPEDEALLWGEASGPAAPTEDTNAPITPEDIWGQEPASGPYAVDQTPPDQAPADTVEDFWSKPPERGPETTLTPDDAYAAAYLTGSDLPPMGEPPGPPQEFLLQQALERQGQDEGERPLSIDEIRAIALEDYQDGLGTRTWVQPEREEQPPAGTVEEAEGLEGTEQSAELPLDAGSAALQTAEVEESAGKKKPWLEAYSPLQKILLAEAAIVVIAMLVAVPFFIMMIARGSLYKEAALQPRPLPAGLPYPTGLILPGGWSFSLSKSTFTNGAWQPVTSEWLEGTELRRVVALPWNPQTEAVIQTFHKGDPVTVMLSNSDTQQYRVTSVERVPVSNQQIYDDRKPSLAIILYQEKAKSRWVIICSP